MQHDDLPIDAQRWLPGIIGSIGAMLWIDATWPRKLSMMALGSAASYYGSTHISALFGIAEGWSGFLLGLFGMSVVDSIFKVWRDIGLTHLVRDALRAKLGLPPKE